MLYFTDSSLSTGKEHGYMTAQRAQHEIGEGKIARLYRGIYCDDSDLEDLPGFMRRNALRITNYLFPESALTHACAVFKGPVDHQKSTREKHYSKILLAGGYANKIELPYLDIVQSTKLTSGRIAQFCQPIADQKDADYGPLYLSCLGDEVAYLQQFGRRRYNLEGFLSTQKLDALRDMLIDRHGNDLSMRLRSVAGEIGSMGYEYDNALTHIQGRRKNAGHSLAGSNLKLDENENAMNNILEFAVGWYGRPVGKLVNNGVAWNFSWDDGWMLPLSVGKTRPGVLPPFIHNLLPEGYTQEAMGTLMGAGIDAKASILTQSERYLSNMAIVQDVNRLKLLPIDSLAGRLGDFNDGDGVFTGSMYEMPNTGPEFISELNRVITDMAMPRFSGAQPKIPCHLDENGVLSPAMDKPFTHILKLPGLGSDPSYLKGVVEWASMTLARAGGLSTCDFSMLELDSGALGYVCERFDIPQTDEDMRMIYAEDFCSLHSAAPIFKMGLSDGENGVATMINGYKSFSTKNPKDDEQLFRLIYTNYLLENADFHMKNASILRVASPTLDSFRTTRLSPAYDIMNTRYFQSTPLSQDFRETMVLKFNGKATNFDHSDFIAMGKLLDMEMEKCMEIMWRTAHGIADAAHKMAEKFPVILDHHPKARQVVANLLERAVKYCHMDFGDVELLEVSQSVIHPPAANIDAKHPADEPEMLKAVRRALLKPR